MNISIYNEAGAEHPTWDFARHAGDRHVQAALAVHGMEKRTLGHPMDGDFLARPADVDVFCNAMAAQFPENESRWQELREILRDPQWWLHFSY